MFLNPFKLLKISHYRATEEDNKKAYIEISNRIKKSKSVHIFTGERSILKKQLFIDILSESSNLGYPRINLCCHIPMENQNLSGFLGSLKEQDIKERDIGIVESALRNGSLRMYFLSQPIKDEPHFTIINNKELMLQRIHKHNLHEWKDMWIIDKIIPLPLRLTSRYKRRFWNMVKNEAHSLFDYPVNSNEQNVIEISALCSGLLALVFLVGLVSSLFIPLLHFTFWTSLLFGALGVFVSCQIQKKYIKRSLLKLGQDNGSIKSQC